MCLVLGWEQGFQQIFPAVTVLFPAADGVHSTECGLAHGALQVRIVGELLQAVGEGDGVADRDDKAFRSIRK